MLPNWKVMARSEFTPSIVRAGIAFEPRAKEIHAEDTIPASLSMQTSHAAYCGVGKLLSEGRNGSCVRAESHIIRFSGSGLTDADGEVRGQIRL